MNNSESKELLNQIASALQTGATAITAYESLASKFKKSEQDIKALEENIKVLKNVNRGKDLLIEAYKEVTEVRFEFCATCNGDGGFYFEGGPGEYGYQPCEECNEKGVLTN